MSSGTTERKSSVAASRSLQPLLVPAAVQLSSSALGVVSDRMSTTGTLLGEPAPAAVPGVLRADVKFGVGAVDAGRLMKVARA